MCKDLPTFKCNRRKRVKCGHFQAIWTQWATSEQTEFHQNLQFKVFWVIIYIFLMDNQTKKRLDNVITKKLRINAPLMLPNDIQDLHFGTIILMPNEKPQNP